MNPFLIFLILLMVVLIWVLGVFLFKPLGCIVKRLVAKIKKVFYEETEVQSSDFLEQEQKEKDINE